MDDGETHTKAKVWGKQVECTVSRLEFSMKKDIDFIEFQIPFFVVRHQVLPEHSYWCTEYRPTALALSQKNISFMCNSYYDLPLSLFEVRRPL